MTIQQDGVSTNSEQRGEPGVSFGSSARSRSGRLLPFGSAAVVDALAGHWDERSLEELSRLLDKAWLRRKKRRGKKKARLLGELAGLVGAAHERVRAVPLGEPFQVFGSADATDPLEVVLDDGTVTTWIPAGAAFSVPMGAGETKQVFMGLPDRWVGSPMLLHHGDSVKAKAPEVAAWWPPAP